MGAGLVLAASCRYHRYSRLQECGTGGEKCPSGGVAVAGGSVAGGSWLMAFN